MQRIFQEIYRLSGVTGWPIKTAVVTMPLSTENFTPDTVFINQNGEPAMSGRLLKLISEPCKGLTPGKCYLPHMPFYRYKGTVPEVFLAHGKVLASIGEANSNDASPAVIEFPGNRFWFNFDPERAIRCIEREQYFFKKRPFYTYFPFNIQKVPPSLRQMASRFLKCSNKKRGKALFPTYPKDFSVELLTNLLRFVTERLGGHMLPAPVWPGGKKYAFILTHDVDSGWIYAGDNLRLFLDEEERLGIHGAWYFVANLYKHDFAKLDRLASEGHEIGLHGDNHDHKIAFLSEIAMRKRLDSCRSFIDKYQVTGFRSPHYLHTPLFYEVLKNYVRYDSSIHDSYNPTTTVGLVREGCSAIHPFTLSDEPDALLEIPVTIPEDYEIYNPALGTASITAMQMAQIDDIKRRGGLANLVIHPEPHLSGRPQCLEAFREVLSAVTADKECWLCLPRDIYEYWTGK